MHLDGGARLKIYYTVMLLDWLVGVLLTEILIRMRNRVGSAWKNESPVSQWRRAFLENEKQQCSLIFQIMASQLCTKW